MQNPMNKDQNEPLINPYGITQGEDQQPDAQKSNSNQNINHLQSNKSNNQQNNQNIPPQQKLSNQMQNQIIKLPAGLKPTDKQYPIIIEKSRQPCSICNYKQTSIVKYSIGCKAVAWSICLCFTTSILLSWVPLVTNCCKDLHVICGRCGHIKSTITNKCCQ